MECPPESSVKLGPVLGWPLFMSLIVITASVLGVLTGNGRTPEEAVTDSTHRSELSSCGGCLFGVGQPLGLTCSEE